MFHLFKDYLSTQLDAKEKKIETKQKIDKETVELKFKGNQKQFKLNAELDSILDQIQTQTFQLSVLKMSEIGHNSPPTAGYWLPMAGSHLGGSGGMPPRKNFENLSPWNAIFCIFRKDLQNSKGTKMSHKISKVTLFWHLHSMIYVTSLINIAV